MREQAQQAVPERDWPPQFDCILDSHTDEPKPGDTYGGYVLKWLIGVGAAGQVWRAEHRLSGSEGAVKILKMTASSALSKAFLAEARVIALLAHPHIVSLYTSGKDYLVTAFIDGGNLARRLQTPLSPAAVIRIATQICSALQYAHSEGVVHRDGSNKHRVSLPTGAWSIHARRQYPYYRHRGEESSWYSAQGSGCEVA